MITECLDQHTHTHNCFAAVFQGQLRRAGARREPLLDFMVQGKIYAYICQPRVIHQTDQLGTKKSIRSISLIAINSHSDRFI